GLVDVAALEPALRLLGAYGPRARREQRDGDVAAGAVPGQRDRNRRAAQREVAVPARVLDESDAGRRVPRRHLDRGQQLIGRERGGELGHEYLVPPQHARAALRENVELRVERRERAWKLGRGIGVHDRAADSPAVADLAVADPHDRVVQQRPPRGDVVAALDLRVTHHRAEQKAAVLDLDLPERFNAVDVDQPARPRKAEVHQRHQTLPAREHLAFVAIARQQADRLVDRARVVVLERRGLHALASSMTRCGLSGSWVTSTPSASATALAIAPPTAAVPPSPAPFTPSGLIGDGASSVMRTSMSGTSSEV